MYDEMNFPALDSFLDSLRTVGVPFCEISVRQNHREIHRYAVRADGHPAAGGLYYMYSCSKPVTAAAALTLMERGRFSIDTPVSDILPEFSRLTAETPAGPVPLSADRPLLMRHLFTMTSGYAYDLGAPALQKVRARTDGRCPTRETVAAMAEIPLHFAPGDAFRYGLSSDILAAAVEVLADEPFADYVRRVIFAPLGMERSSFRVTPELLSRMEPQYKYNASAGRAVPSALSNAFVLGTEYASGGAGLVSCAEDMARFCDALSMRGVGDNGARILSEESVERMRTPMLTPRQKAAFVWKELGNSYSYGLSVRVRDNPDGDSRSPLGEFGWGGAAGSLMVCCPEQGLSAFFAMHMLGCDIPYMHPRIIDLLFA